MHPFHSGGYGKQVSVPILLRMRGRLSPENVLCTFRGLETLGGSNLAWEELGGFTWEALA